jgi:hypothetical protein
MIGEGPGWIGRLAKAVADGFNILALLGALV